MRVVIDTNVLVSGVINPHGAPGRIVEAGYVHPNYTRHINGCQCTVRSFSSVYLPIILV